MNIQIINQCAGSQKEINKLFLKACTQDDVDLVKYLLNSKELLVNAQLNINKQTGFVDEKKDGFLPLILAVSHNSKKVYTYFLEEIDWFNKLTHDGKVEVLSKATYTNDIETMDYLFKKYENSGKLSEYQKPFALNKILDSVIEKNSDKVFDYLMNLPQVYLTHRNTKYDQEFIKCAKTNNNILVKMLNHAIYKELSVELYLNAFEVTKKNPHTALTLFKYGIEKNMFDIWLTKKANSYIRDKVRYCVFNTFTDSVINYINEEQTKLSYPQRLIDLANENIKDYFFTEDEHQTYKNNQNIAPVLEYAIKHKLLSKEIKEQIVFDILKHSYMNLLDIVSKYPHYGEGLDLTKSFYEIVNKNTIAKEKYRQIQQVLNLDIDKKIVVWAEDFAFFKTMENIKDFFNQNYDEVVKKVFVEYEFWPNDTLKTIYKNNPDMLNLVDRKILKMKLSEQNDNQPSIKVKPNKI